MSFNFVITALMLICFASALLFNVAEFIFFRKKITLKTLLLIIPQTLFVIGFIGFLSFGLSIWGGTNLLPETFEWPVGKTTNFLVTKNGTNVVLLPDSGRVQIYNDNLEFQRSWGVYSSKGHLKIQTASDSKFYIFSDMEHRKLLFDNHGNLHSTENYSMDEYRNVKKNNQSLEIPTVFYLKIFSHPVLPWLLMAISAFVAFIINKFVKI
jgi:hypothetical protein